MSAALSSMVTIPAPEWDDAAFQPLANLSTSRGSFRFYWWNRRVVLFDAGFNKWRMCPNWTIGATLEVLTGIDAVDMEADLMLFTGRQGASGNEWVHGEEMDEERQRYFFDCKWSDYACDYLRVSGHVSERADAVAVVPRPWPGTKRSAGVVWPPSRPWGTR
jgi:hypothetical protein